MGLAGMISLVSDNMILHKLWDASKNNENCNSKDESHSKTQLFKEKSESIVKHDFKEWILLFVGIFFIAGVAGIGTYQAYQSNKVFIRYSFSLPTKNLKKDYLDDPPGEMYNKNYLPRNVVPHSYLLYIHPDLNSKYYCGLVKITLSCLVSTSQVVLHSSYHNITKILLRKPISDPDNIENIVIRSKYRSKEKRYLILDLDSNLAVDEEYELFIGFYNTLDNDVNKGIYISEYKDGNGVNRQMVSTMFEPKYAKGTFPCFDEPDMKATFKIIVQHEREHSAISNMPEERKVNVGTGNVETFFLKSPLMSTYLVAFAVTEYHFLDVYDRRNIRVRIYAPEGRTSEVSTALKIAPLALDYYSERFGVNYSLPKLDLMPVTRLTAGADETWGMIIFVENLLLFNKHFSSIFHLEAIAQVISHEISHQWFGNLVTMKTWKDLWLKETFATYLQYLPLLHYYPTWDVETTVFLEINTQAMSLDASFYTHSVIPNNTDMKSLSDIYDGITYKKGAAIIAMVSSVLGEDTFFYSLQRYLEKYKYGNADSKQFFEIFNQNQTHFDVTSFTHSWLTTPGFPMLTLKRIGNKLIVNQERFKPKWETQENKELWSVPISIDFIDVNRNITVYLQNKTGSIKIPSNSSLYKLNAGGNGFYRVNYDEQSWLTFLDHLNYNHSVFSAVDRSNILSDMFSLAEFDYHHFDFSLKFTKYLTNESYSTPWIIGLRHLSRLQTLNYGTNVQKCIEQYILRLIEPTLNNLNSKKKHTERETKLIAILINAAVEYDYQPLVVELNNNFLRWLLSDGVNIPGNIRLSVMQAGIKYGGVNEWNRLFERYRTATSLQSAHMYLISLATSRDQTLLKRLVDYTFNDTLIPNRHKIPTLAFVCNNRLGSRYAKSAMERHWSSLYKINTPAVKRLLAACFANGRTYADLDEAKDFFDDHDLGALEHIRFRIQESITRNIEIVNRKDQVEAFFEDDTCLIS